MTTSYNDPIVYAILVESVPGKGRIVRQRHHALRLGEGERVEILREYFAQRQHTYHWKVGKVGQERTVLYVDGATGELLRIDGSGVPACIGWLPVPQKVVTHAE